MIKDLEKGQSIIGYFAVKDIAEKETKEQKKYLDLTLVDSSGEINAKVWDISQSLLGEMPQKSEIVKTDANVEEYKGVLQLKINKIRKAKAEDNYDPDAIIPRAPVPVERMYAVLCRFIEAISNDSLKQAVAKIIEEHKEKIMYYPAAKTNHHSYLGGFLHHTTTMLLAAERLSTLYQVNTDLLYAGIILHDIGKLYELTTDETCIGTEYSLEGELLGHIAIGIRIIERAEGLENEQKLLLQHIILSHHQNPEWGSPKRPMLKEAELLHHLDMIDSRMNDFLKAENQTQQGCLTPKIFQLDRKIYCTG
jgi:3'-5' exoribonuclease